GANRVDAPGATHGVAWSALGAVLAAALLIRSPRRAPAWVVAFAALACLPGLSAWAGRADGPLHARSSAARVDRLASDIETYARERGCAGVVRSSCVACDPVVRFALAKSARCATPAPIVLEADAVEAGCVERSGALVCGTLP
ncbi:MAG TPA: hypothetical protein VLM85_21860, partial [Polyangiaceae bacterium]|nr:hypothetical protein [Polyangiaceae bacterium]